MATKQTKQTKETAKPDAGKLAMRKAVLSALGVSAADYLVSAQDAEAAGLSVWAQCCEAFEKCGADRAEVWAAINAEVGDSSYQPEAGEGVAVDGEGMPCFVVDASGPSDTVRALAGFSTLKAYVNACARAVARGVSLFHADGTTKGRTQVQKESAADKGERAPVQTEGEGAGEGAGEGEGASVSSAPELSAEDRARLALGALIESAELRNVPAIAELCDKLAAIRSHDKAEEARAKLAAARSRKAAAEAKAAQEKAKASGLAQLVEARALITGESPEVAKAAILAPSVAVAA